MEKSEEKNVNKYLEEGIYDLGETLVEVGCI